MNNTSDIIAWDPNFLEESPTDQSNNPRNNPTVLEDTVKFIKGRTDGDRAIHGGGYICTHNSRLVNVN